MYPEFVLVVFVVDSDLTTNWLFMHDWHYDCITDCYGALTIVWSYMCLLTLCSVLWLLMWTQKLVVSGYFHTFDKLWQKGGVIIMWDGIRCSKMSHCDGIDMLICCNHLTYMLLMLLLLYAMLIILGDMMWYLCYFMKITYSSYFCQNLLKREIVCPFGWLH